MIIVNHQQGSDAWFQEKLGKPSSSNASKIITNGGKSSKQAEAYMYELAAEIITGTRAESFKSASMEEGNNREAESISYFEMVNDVSVDRVGLVYKDEARLFLCSPDAIIRGKEEGLECKNPMAKTQVKYLLDGCVPEDYFSQVQMSLYITGFKIWNFISYVPLMPALMLRVERDEAFIKQLDIEMNRFVKDLQDVVRRIKQ